mmetsp:Transcript_214/g.385  ORF Transcript_214/g.385 Transcript_214/m.385 type:complete len:290 (-) Transcript_214:194-1063(-)|eukprot:CAMPEP_0201667594 /NCGR_PEP_ID=MMETSP0494-20130426/15734_1 /ASSEMBLY_ACC=CAM_ASM_000839 /TAXON_ID=420259 /ORGANISM="Thalassiosira gravida, Strain GMp14c1" /LENGTH=289 /DNA_ID=CAMNT_0048147639 /DNA_START=33 /DNA_END=902 /DNA_ORIENTATION=-
MPATKKVKTNDGTPSNRGGGALTSTTIDDLTALTTAQLYSLSSRRHRDESRESVRRAQEERDRAYVSLEQSQRWLERANEHLERQEENAREAHREYMDAKNLLVRVRQASSAAVEMMGGRAAAYAAADDSSDDEGGALGLAGRMSSGGFSMAGSKSRKGKVPFVQDILIEFAKAGELADGKKLADADTELVARKDRSQFANSMKLIEELWTEEEELFLRSGADEIAESLEELKVIAETIAVRCLTKLNEWEGRTDPTPTGHQKPSFISIGTRARRVFVSRKKGEVEEEV